MVGFGISGVKTSVSINLPDVSSAVCDVPSTLWSLNQIQNTQTEHTIITHIENDVT